VIGFTQADHALGGVARRQLIIDKILHTAASIL
jgi:hypothetical protein